MCALIFLQEEKLNLICFFAPLVGDGAGRWGGEGEAVAGGDPEEEAEAGRVFFQSIQYIGQI